jgi:YcaO-like protein with predicted kinase domain
MSTDLRAKPPPPHWGQTAEGDRILSIRSRTLSEVEALAQSQLERAGVTRVSDVTGLDVVGIPVWHSIRPTAQPGNNPRRLILKRSHTWTPDTPLTWWPTREVRRNVEVWVPALAIFIPFPNEAGMMRSSTMGLAAGNDQDEAVLHGLYEVIEHDCTAFGELLNIGYRIRPETLPDPARALVEQFKRAAVAVTLHAYSNGIGIPTFFAVTEDTHARDGMLFNGGAGCHLDPETGVLRALTEVAQSRLAVIGGAREDMDAFAYRRHASYDKLRERIMRWSESRPWCGFDEFASQTTGTVAGDLQIVLDRLQKDGMDLVLVTELAPEDFPFSVVQAVVPGSEWTHLDSERVGVRLATAQRRLATKGRETP